jgi:transposase
LEIGILNYLYSKQDSYINGIEGFFILESSVDEGPEKILKLYKERDKAEKFFRALKEGIELRPLRHWNKWSIIGVFFISFLANLLINLTLFLNKNSPIKQAKLLKKFLINLTLTVVYPEKGFRFHVLSNVSPQILGIFGNFVWKFEDKSLSSRW